MKFFFKTGLILSVTVLVMGIASANKADSVDKVASIPTDSKTYTATGSTDVKTAQMLVNLLRNPHLKVKAEVNKTPKSKIAFPQNTNDPVYTAHGKTDKKTAQMLINLLRNPHLRVKAEVHPSSKQKNNLYYSISGRTNVANIKKLQALLKSNKQINITVQANKKTSSAISLNARTQPAQQYLYQDYSTIIAQGLPFYHNGRPPVFIRGNTLWYPVAVTTQAPSEQKAQKVSE